MGGVLSSSLVRNTASRPSRPPQLSGAALTSLPPISCNSFEDCRGFGKGFGESMFRPRSTHTKNRTRSPLTTAHVVYPPRDLSLSPAPSSSPVPPIRADPAIQPPIRVSKHDTPLAPCPSPLDTKRSKKGATHHDVMAAGSRSESESSDVACPTLDDCVQDWRRGLEKLSS
jgi:hypothetical protein